jgi:hypothetical protein
MDKYVVFRNHMGTFDGFLHLNGKRTDFYAFQIDGASQLTLKQATKKAFDLNKEARDNYSYYYRYGVQKI